MLLRGQAKTALIVFLILTPIALGLAIAASVFAFLNNYAGIFTTTSTTFVCSPYLTLKMEYNNVSILNMSFFGGGFSAVVTLLVLIQLIYLGCKLRGSEGEEFPDFTEPTFVRLYIGYSLAMLGAMIGTGYFLTYIFQQGMNCYGSILLNWILMAGLYGAALLLLLICWIVLICLRQSTMEQFEEQEQDGNKSQVLVDMPNENLQNYAEKVEQDQFKNKPEQEPQTEETKKQKKKQEKKRMQEERKKREEERKKREEEEIKKRQQTEKMLREAEKRRQEEEQEKKLQEERKKQEQELMAQQEEARMENFIKSIQEVVTIQGAQTNKNDDLRQPLLESSVSSEEEDEENPGQEQPEKLVVISYQAYLEKQNKKKKKEQEKQDLIQQLLKQQEQERKEKQLEQALKKAQVERKRKLMMTAMSPDDPEFNKIFLESDDEEENNKKKQPQQKKEEQHYPANFVPSNEEERKKFEAYKKKLLRRFKNHNNKNKKGNHNLRHPQNIEGGRSKKAVKKFLLQNKRPPRNEITYFQRGKQIKPVTLDDMSSSSDSEQYDERPQSPKFNDTSRYLMTEPSIIVQMTPPPRPMKVEEMVQREPDQLYFSKQKVKLRGKKLLFEHNDDELTRREKMVKQIEAVEAAKRKKRLEELRQHRNKNRVTKSRNGQKLIEYIRSSYM